MIKDGVMYVNENAPSHLKLGGKGIRKVVFEGRPHIESLEFYGDVEEVDFGRAEGYEMKSTAGMFKDCKKLKSVDMSNFSTSDIYDSSEMFKGCTSLKSVDLTDEFRLDCVRDTHSMFEGCESLESVKFQFIDTRDCVDMSNMFKDCKKLKKLDLRRFDTWEARENMNGMFDGCESLKEIQVSDGDPDDYHPRFSCDSETYGFIKDVNSGDKVWVRPHTRNGHQVSGFFRSKPHR